MEYLKQDYSNALLFIEAYLHMEKATLTANRKILKAIIPERKFDHIFDSWASRENNFGNFFLNLDHKIQCLIILNWGIEIPEHDDYLVELESNPYASSYTIPPVTVSKLYQLLLFFNNHGIDENVIDGFKLPNLPVNRYGNSTNWGNYIVSLSSADQERLIHRLTDIGIEGIKDQNKNRDFLKKAMEQQTNK